MNTITKENLNQFTGTESLHKFSILFPRLLLTDGAKFVADSLGAYWLMDIVGSVQHMSKVRHEAFQTWTLKVKNGKGHVEATDGNDNVIYRQRIAYTDFPMDEITLYVGHDGEQRVIMLPSEY